jgi:hypothetical protein
VLNLEKNNLSGEFPDLSKFPQLTLLDLSSNDLLTGILLLPQKDETVDETADLDKANDPISPAIIATVVTLAIVVSVITALVAYKYQFRESTTRRKNSKTRRLKGLKLSLRQRRQLLSMPRDSRRTARNFVLSQESAKEGLASSTKGITAGDRLL